MNVTVSTVSESHNLSDVWLGLVVFLVVMLALGAAYLTPTIVAASRRRPDTVRIALLNFLLGWTLVGWGAALVLALGKRPVDLTTFDPAAGPRSSAPSGPDTTFAALLASDFPEQALGSMAELYRKNWLVLAEKAGVLDMPIVDAASRRAIAWVPSPNIFAGFGVLGWLLYRRVTYAWPVTLFVLILWETLNLLLPDKDFERVLGLAAPLAFFAFRYFADSWLLWTITRERALREGEVIVHRSPTNVALFLGVFVFLIVADGVLESLWPTSHTFLSPTTSEYIVCVLSLACCIGSMFIALRQIKYATSILAKNMSYVVFVLAIIAAAAFIALPFLNSLQAR
jgi:hypothetical protein